MRFASRASVILCVLLISEGAFWSHLARADKCNCETRKYVKDVTSVCDQPMDKTSGVIQYHAGATNLTVTCHIILNIAPFTTLSIHLRRRPCASPNQTVSLFGIDPNDDNTPMKQLQILENKEGENYIFNGTVFILSYFNKPEGEKLLEQSFVLEFEGRHENTDISQLPSPFEYQNFIISNPTRSMSSPDFEFSSNQFTTWFIHGPIYDNRMISYMYDIGLNFLNVSDCPDCVFSVSRFYEDDARLDLRSKEWVRSFYTSSQYPIRVFEHTFTSIVATLRIGNTSLVNPEFLMRWNWLSR